MKKNPQKKTNKRRPICEQKRGDDDDDGQEEKEKEHLSWTYFFTEFSLPSWRVATR